MISEKIGKYFDDNYNDILKYFNKNLYYYNELVKLCKFIIPENVRILDIGCGIGYILNSLNPSYGVGIDCSENMISVPKSRYSHLKFIKANAEDFSLNEKFDYILLCNLVGYLEDVQKIFQNIKKNCNKDTRIVILNYNFLWEWSFKLAESLQLKFKEPLQNWLSTYDLENLLYLSGFQIIKTGKKTLLPVNIPILSWFFNKYVGNLPLINNLCLNQYIVARLIDLDVDKNLSCSVIIPARNEAGNIEEAVRRIIPEMGRFTEIIFVEGGSKDNTLDEIKRVAEKYTSKKIIKWYVQDGRGKYDAVQKGFNNASGDILMILDADLTVAPEDLPKFFDAITNNKGELINGNRLIYPVEKEAMRLLNIFGNKVFAILFTWILGQKFKDTLCGTKVIYKKNYEKIRANKKFFGDFDPFGDFDLIFGAAKLNLKIVDMPVRYRERTYGRTNISRFKHGWILFKMCLFVMRKMKFI